MAIRANFYPVLSKIHDYRYRVFGDPPSQRAAEDIAYSVARFFSKNGSFVNYYMVKWLKFETRIIKFVLS